MKSTIPSFDKETYKSLVSSWQKTSDKTEKVLIVGAGISGLYAAYTLEYLGFQNYEILEASDRLGGRLMEIRNFLGEENDGGLPFDGGAEWIHYVEPRVLQDLMLFEDQTVTVETIKYQPQTWSTFTNGRRYERNFIKHLYSENKFKNTTWHSYVEHYIVSKINRDAVRFNTAVKSIDSTNPKEVVITSTDGRVFTGSNVVVTASVGVLQQDPSETTGIDFVPPMSEKWRAEMNKIEFAPGFKGWFQMKTKFYPDFQMIGSLLEQSDRSQALYFDGVLGKPTSQNVLTSLQIGDISAKRSTMSDSELIETMLKELDEVFDGQASTNLMKTKIQNWTAEPYIRGTYSVSSNYNKKILRAGTGDGRIVFAGEHLGEPQTVVQGAALSGRRAIETILSSSLAFSIE